MCFILDRADKGIKFCQWWFVHWTKLKSLPCHHLSRLDIVHIIASIYLLYHLAMLMWAEGCQRATADLWPFLPIIVLIFFYYKTYFNLEFISLITRSQNQLYGSWKHGKQLMESWNGAFNGWTTSLVRENSIEYHIRKFWSKTKILLQLLKTNEVVCSH